MNTMFLQCSPFFQAGVGFSIGTFYQWQDGGENTAADDSVQGESHVCWDLLVVKSVKLFLAAQQAG